MKKIYFFFTILLLFLSSSLLAVNTVILKNGRNLKGLVVNQDDKGLTLKLSDGTTQTVPKSQILKVIYKDLNEQEAQKIRLAEEKKLQAKEEAERKKLEKEQKLAEEAEKKRQAEEAKKAEALAKDNESKKAKEDAVKAQESADQAKSDAEWLVYREKNKVPSEATVACGSRLGMVWRSALVPGWGQWCGGYKLSAGIFAGMFVGSIYYSQNAMKHDSMQKQQTYDDLTLLNQYGGPVTKIGPENITNTNDLVGVLVEYTLVNNFISESKKTAQTANAKYLGSLGGIGLIYIANIVHAYWIGRERYPDRPTVTLNGKSIQEGFDWDTRVDQPFSLYGYQPKPSSVYGEVRYSIVF
ncbi:LA_0442/LA_0875 N-terminal domain-containing protein [Leptospira idonii]|uniref:DUF5683 domain-containing protein n=1 Tax=Leptospira idonii TaxID=1193500 RepID=A0A4R9M2Y7_9LEPT|nr:hypothetical protein [Leptospira idonii]TGN21154.1 hypothetical protein EHS15_01150 [Leptospira idonii]